MLQVQWEIVEHIVFKTGFIHNEHEVSTQLTLYNIYVLSSIRCIVHLCIVLTNLQHRISHEIRFNHKKSAIII